MPILILNNVWFCINLRFYSTCQLKFETSETLTCEIIRVFCQNKIWETKCFHIISLLSGETIEILKQSHVWFFFSFSVGSSPETSHHLSSRIQCKHFSGGIRLSVYITCIIYLMPSVSSFMIKKNKYKHTFAISDPGALFVYVYRDRGKISAHMVWTHQSDLNELRGLEAWTALAPRSNHGVCTFSRQTEVKPRPMLSKFRVQKVKPRSLWQTIPVSRALLWLWLNMRPIHPALLSFLKGELTGTLFTLDRL